MGSAGGTSEPAHPASGAADRVGAESPLALLVVLVLPFLVYLAPYAIAVNRGLAAPGTPTFTVDEPLYLAEAAAIAQGRPADWNPWTRASGGSPDTYRVFAGSLVPATIWEWTGFDRGLGLGVVSGLAAALASWLVFRLLRGLFPTGAAPWLWALAPVAVLFPWQSVGEVTRLHVVVDELGAALPLARPFTSQWGPVVFLLGIAASVRAGLRGGAIRIAEFSIALLLQVWTFPFAVPLTLGTHVLALVARRAGRPAAEWVAGIVVPVLIAGIALAWAATRALPAEGEASRDLVSATRFGGSGVLVVVLAAIAWFARRRFRPACAWFLPVLCILLALARLGDAVLPQRLLFTHHVIYLADAVLALTALALLAVGLETLGPARARAGAVVLLLAATGWSVAATTLSLRAQGPKLERTATWSRAMAALPHEEGVILLTEGEKLDGPGAWAALESPWPLLYSFTSEYSTTGSVEDRHWRRAWYHHLRGLDAADLRKEGPAIVKRFPRIFGAHNVAPSAEVLPRLEALLAQIEKGTPEAWTFLQSFGTLAILDDPAKPLFVAERLDRASRLLGDRRVGDLRVSYRAVRGL